MAKQATKEAFQSMEVDASPTSEGSAPGTVTQEDKPPPRRSTVKPDPLRNAPEYQKYMHLKYPRVVEFIEGNSFEMGMGVIIMYNCFTIGMDTHMCPPKNSLRSNESCPEAFLIASEHICTFLFVAEFFVRGLCSGFKYHIAGPARIFDVCLVWLTGVLLTWFIVPIMGSGPSQVRMLVSLRAFRLLRVARVIRFNFKEMWLMLRGLAGSSKALLSMIAVFIFIFYLFGILAVSLIGDYDGFDQADDNIMAVHEFFNGLDKAMWTLLQMVTADSWSSGIARPIINVIPSMWLYFALYIAIAMMVLMNLVTAIIVDNAMNQSKQDQEQLLLELEKKKEEEFKQLKKMFLALDKDGSGELDEEEFESALDEQPDIIDQFKLLGFEEDETRNFFYDLDNGDGSLSTEEFIGGLRSMQGEARAADLIRTKQMVIRLNGRMDKLFKHLGVPEGQEGEAAGSDPGGDGGSGHGKYVGGNPDRNPGLKFDLPGQVPGSPIDSIYHEAAMVSDSGLAPEVLQVVKQQLMVAQETSSSLDAMYEDIRQQIDKRLNDFQHIVMSASQTTVNAITAKSEVSKEWLHDVRVSVAEVCRKELVRQMEKSENSGYNFSASSPPQTLPSVPGLPKKKMSVSPERKPNNKDLNTMSKTTTASSWGSSQPPPASRITIPTTSQSKVPAEYTNLEE